MDIQLTMKLNSLKLRLSMVGTVAIIISVSTLGIALIMASFGNLSLGSLVITVAAFNLLQWLLAPYIINVSYRVKRIDANTNHELYSNLKDLSNRSGIRMPKLMVSELNIPNAFAYGSPLTGNHVAVTKGLLQTLDSDEVNAVISHELGHIKHRDMHIMMLASFLPSLFYIVSRSMLFTRDRERNGLQLVGAASLLIYLLLTLTNLGLSRLREYYADQHSASLSQGNARKLSEALAKISQSTLITQEMAPKQSNSGSFKALFILDPDTARADLERIHKFNYNDSSYDFVDQIRRRRLSGFEKFMELFSTHPNIVKRLQALRDLETS